MLSNLGPRPSSKMVSWMFYFLVLNDAMLVVLTCSDCSTTSTKTFSIICWRLNPQPCLRWSSPCFLFNRLLITAAEMSMPDALRCWQDIPRFWRTGMFYPFPIIMCGFTDIKLKIHIEIPGHTQNAEMSKHQQMGKTFNNANLCIQ